MVEHVQMMLIDIHVTAHLGMKVSLVVQVSFIFVSNFRVRSYKLINQMLSK